MTVEIRVPGALWQSVLDLFAPHDPSVERVAYLDGFRVDETGYPGRSPDGRVYVAVTVVVPDAVLRPRNYLVPAEAVRAAGRMTRVAQVHSHGDDFVDHSPTDDERAYSQRTGAVSVVVPFHGRTRPGLAECGVHVRAEAGWRRVRPESVIRIIPSILDLRSTKWVPTPEAAPSGGIFSRFPAWTRTAWTRRVRSRSS
ncbi:hypothetical protein [Amycolatopsis sp. DG1A-15b]|uniref:hypothetical protein n=1 Tax=Amycolatopsis sp. DG1A-15b TaxID=3052846 RepID=UPI00255B7124|nr:hypothetical protein [Amycolatopsis sp. DG1A-15b]WIX92513.1 hypothetical protein QRY02_19570 [Amycolatopsis sp. DG1A-15b]